MFDKNYKLLDFAYAQVTSTGAPGYLMSEYTVKEAGYAYLFISNENPTQADVYFDDVKMSYTPSNVIQYNEYYPFGMQTTNSWTRENTTGNNFLGNGGTELNASSNLYDLYFRNYDPVLGRMTQIDPLASKYGSHTPYNYSLNSPVRYNDPLGDDVSWGDISRIVNTLWRQAAYSPGGQASAKIWDTGTFGPGGGGGSFGGGGSTDAFNRGSSSNFFSSGWRPGSGGLSSTSFARMDAQYSQYMASKEAQMGFTLFPGAISSGNGQGYYSFVLSPALYNSSGDRLADQINAVGTLDFGKTDYQDMFSESLNNGGGILDKFFQGASDARSNLISVSGVTSGWGAISNGADIAVRSDARYTSNFTRLRGIANASRYVKLGGAGLGYISAIATGFESFYDEDGFTLGDGIKVGVGLGVTTIAILGSPLVVAGATVYGLADLGFGLFTNASLTDRLGKGIDSMIK